MSILIKGMDMPKSCLICFARRDVDIGVGIADGCDLLKAMICNPGERLDDCPLVPVPPHGRLIDADEAVELLNSLGNRQHRREEGTICDAIKMLSSECYTPTIIEAEEGRANDE